MAKGICPRPIHQANTSDLFKSQRLRNCVESDLFPIFSSHLHLGVYFLLVPTTGNKQDNQRSMWKIPSIFFTLVIFTNQVSQAFLAPVSASAPLFVARQLRAGSQDTPETLPDFKTAEDYLKYMESVSALPKGFSTGTADGTFVSVEAPSLGNLKIRGTIIYVSSGPTDNWAACYTSNKVRLPSCVQLTLSLFPWICLC